MSNFKYSFRMLPVNFESMNHGVFRVSSYSYTRLSAGLLLSGVVENQVRSNEGRCPLLKGDNKEVIHTNSRTICTGDKITMDPLMQKTVHLLHAVLFERIKLW